MQKNLFRYERKFIDASLLYEDIKHLIKIHPANFKKIFEPRYINNVYLDDNSLSLFSKNIDGIYDRVKFRIRWYGDLGTEIKHPVLELKIKKGLLGYKKHYRLNQFNLDYINQNKYFKRIISDDNLPDSIKEFLEFMNPKLINRYKRCYYISNNFPEIRLTLDNKIKYYNPNNIYNKTSHVKENYNIIELKYDFGQDQNIEFVCEHLKLRLSKFSKYVNGIVRIYK